MNAIELPTRTARLERRHLGCKEARGRWWDMHLYEPRRDGWRAPSGAR